MQWILQVCEEATEEDIPNRDGTWFDGIGERSFHKTGRMVVSVLCRGNYVCGSLSTIKEVKDMYKLMTGKELFT